MDRLERFPVVWTLIARIRADGISEMTGSTQTLSPKELDVSRRIPVALAEHLVAESLIQLPGLVAVCLDRRPDVAPRASVGLRLLHKSCSVSSTACRFSDPQISHLQPASPELAEQPA